MVLFAGAAAANIAIAKIVVGRSAPVATKVWCRWELYGMADPLAMIRYWSEKQANHPRVASVYNFLVEGQWLYGNSTIHTFECGCIRDATICTVVSAMVIRAVCQPR
jgi:hypothetical protein